MGGVVGRTKSALCAKSLLKLTLISAQKVPRRPSWSRSPVSPSPWTCRPAVFGLRQSHFRRCAWRRSPHVWTFPGTTGSRGWASSSQTRAVGRGRCRWPGGRSGSADPPFPAFGCTASDWADWWPTTDFDCCWPRASTSPACSLFAPCSPWWTTRALSDTCEVLCVLFTSVCSVARVPLRLPQSFSGIWPTLRWRRCVFYAGRSCIRCRSASRDLVLVGARQRRETGTCVRRMPQQVSPALLHYVCNNARFWQDIWI